MFLSAAHQNFTVLRQIYQFLPISQNLSQNIPLDFRY